ncbi:MAG: ATP-binding protein [Bacteroidales bacterium]|nr:ATP-binding protein [Bacteroidales bacterium]
MRSPFVFGKIAAGSCFMDREQECAQMVDNFCNLTNTVLISPRRWGKSSLVRRASERAAERDKQLRICHLDIFNVRSEEEFYEKLAECVLTSTSSRWEEMMSAARRYLSSLMPVLSVGDPQNSVSFSFTKKPVRNNADEVLDLAERIAEEKKLSLVVCIDEFQQIACFDDPEAFQAKLRSHWQLHQRVAYCLYGSRRHMMTEIFTNPGKPFYKFGQNIFLDKIARVHWPPFIISKFRETGKSISEVQCLKIAELTEDNPYYIQQLSEMVWNRTAQVCEDEMIADAFQSLVESQAGLNLALTQTLTITQQNLLHAIVDGVVQLTSASVLEKYGLKNSLTVQRAKKVLVRLDILDDFGRVITMEDPIYAWWLRHIYFA